MIAIYIKEFTKPIVNILRSLQHLEHNFLARVVFEKKLNLVLLVAAVEHVIK